MYKKQALLLSFILLSIPNITAYNPISISSVDDAITLFPMTVESINDRLNATINNLKDDLERLIAISAFDRTFENTVEAYDNIIYMLRAVDNAICTLELVHPDEAIREAAHQADLKLKEFDIDVIENIQIYNAFMEYCNGNKQSEQITKEQEYVLNRFMENFVNNGFDKPDKLPQLKALSKEMNELEIAFGRNIATDNRTIEVTRDGLAGMTDEFIESKKTEQGRYVLGNDHPTYFNIMANCSVESTRKSLFYLFFQQAWPANITILESMINKCDEYARILGFKSYADYDIHGSMAGSVENVEHFLNDLAAKVIPLATQKMKEIIDHRNDDIELTEDGNIKPWNLLYLFDQYKKKYYQVDEVEISTYFPLEQTIDRLLQLFENFLHISIEKVPVKAWHKDVQALAVYNKDKTVLHGYILLDLYPRDNKFKHAMSMSILATLDDGKGTIYPAVNVVVANFPPSTPENPSLLMHRDVSTLFHEIGHSFHDVLGTTHYATVSGKRVKRDFVEMPSQMLEKWMGQPEVLKKVSGHYKTGESLPDDIIERKINSTPTRSIMIADQLYLASFSLACYKEGAVKDVHALAHALHTQLVPYKPYDPNNYKEASFEHIIRDNYRSKYYGYLWSLVYADDIFDTIKKAGIFNSEIGKRYVDEILAKGGSAEPSELIKNFLQREPNSDAFFIWLAK